MVIDLRSEIEAAIDDEERTLGRVRELIVRQVPIAAWPEEDRVSLGLALLSPDLGVTEQWKVTALRRHLFGPDLLDLADLFDPLPAAPTICELRRAERLRGDLTSLVRLRAGLAILPGG